MDNKSKDNIDEVEVNKRIKKAYDPSLTIVDVRDYYNNWVGIYENDLAPGRYKGPEQAAAFVDLYCNKDKSSTRVLDIAAGTGFVGEQLIKRGFKNIDALDPSEKMLEIAKSKNIYKRYICEFLTGDNTSIQEYTYDFVVCSGGFGQSHIPHEALYEISRITKVGGIIVNVMREEYLHVDYYKDKLKPLMRKLQEEGRLEEIHTQAVENYFSDKAGIVFIHKVLP